MDHFTKFHVIYPLKTKSADEVATKFRDRVLGYFGAPKRFHSDNGKEFVNEVLHKLLEKWNPDITVINGRPRHSQSQGLVERGNREVEKKLTNMKNEAGITGNKYPWSSWLSECMFNMNMQTSSTTNETPYHLVFGVAPPSHEGVLGSRVLDEEEMDDIDEISVASDDVTAGTTSEAVHVGEEISAVMDDVDVGTTSEAGKDEAMDHFSMSFMFDDDEDNGDVTPAINVTDEDVAPAANGTDEDNDGVTPADNVTDEEPWEPVYNTVQEETVTSIRRAVKRKAQESTEKAAKRFANQYNKKLKACPDFKEGDTISVLIPPNERSSTDLPRLPGVVIEAKGTSSRLYTIGTAHGILNIGYRTADLQIYSGQVDIQRDKTITLRKAVMLTNPTTLHTTKSCKCKGKCDTLRCPCKKSQITCSTHAPHIVI